MSQKLKLAAVLVALFSLILAPCATAQELTKVEILVGAKLYLVAPETFGYAPPTAEMAAAADTNKRKDFQTTGQQLNGGWWQVNYPATEPSGKSVTVSVFVFDSPAGSQILDLTPPSGGGGGTNYSNSGTPVPFSRMNWNDNVLIWFMLALLFPILWYFKKDMMQAERRYATWVLLIGLPLYFFVSLFTPVFTTVKTIIFPGVFIAWEGVSSILTGIGFLGGLALITILAISALPDAKPDLASDGIAMQVQPTEMAREAADKEAYDKGYRDQYAEVPNQGGTFLRYYRKMMTTKHRESSPITITLLFFIITVLYTKTILGFQFDKVGFPIAVGLSVFVIPFMLPYVSAVIVQFVETYFEASGAFWKMVTFALLLTGAILVILPVFQQLAFFVPVFFWLYLTLPPKDFKSQVADWLLFMGLIFLGGVAFGWPLMTRIVNPVWVTVSNLAGSLLHMPVQASFGQYVDYIVQAVMLAWQAGF